MINWDTVWTAAVTALVVTAAFEYSLKPRLEVRKQRFLDMVSTRNRLHDKLLTAGTAAAVVRQPLPADMPREVADTFRAEQRRRYERMRQTIIDLYDNSGRYASVYAGPVRTQLISCLAVLYGVAGSRRTQRRQGELVQEISALIADGLDVRHWWRVPAAVRALGIVELRLREIEAEGDLEHQRCGGG